MLKIFRQITYLVISSVKLLLSRNFYQKSVKENFRTAQGVTITTFAKKLLQSLLFDLTEKSFSLIAH